MKKILLIAFVVTLTNLMANSAFAQGVFNFSNTTFQNYTYQLIAAEDWCGNINLTGVMPLPAASTTSYTAPTTPPWTGAWKAVVFFDQCSIMYIVEHPQQCFFSAPTLLPFTDCAGNTVTLEWINENNAILY